MTHGVLCAYSGYLRDENLLRESASGGFAFAIALKHILSGGVAYSVRYSPDFRVGEWDRADSVEKLSNFKGSKYVESRKLHDGFNLYQLIKSDLEAGIKVLAIGLPCDIGAIKSYLKKDYKNLTCVDLICHGPVEKRVVNDFLSFLEKKYKSRLVNFSVRYKKNGNWIPLYLRAEFENGKVFLKPFYETDYGIAFSIMSKRACYNCRFKGDNHKSDLTIGDYWGLTRENKAEWNNSGVSVGFVRTPGGEKLLESIRDICTINNTNVDFAMSHNPMMNKEKVKSPLYDSFVYNYDRYGLHTACRKVRPLHVSLLIAIERCVKKRLPEEAVEICKRVLRSKFR